MARLILFNKPFRVLSQFTHGDGKRTLAEFNLPRHVYAAGRLDWDSEGLLLLTDDGALIARLSHPQFHLPKTYWAQVEGLPDESALTQLRQGLQLNDGPTRPAKADLLATPTLWPRDPPIRVRQSVPDAWLALTLTEGRNRQVRRMTAAVGHPTLRLVRVCIGAWSVAGLAPGTWREVEVPTAPSARRSARMRPAKERP